MEVKSNTKRCTCIILGAAGAGKTSLVRRYFRGTFERGKRVPTMGSDFYTGRVQVSSAIPASSTPNAGEQRINGDHNSPATVSETKDNSITATLQVWDTAGRERKAKYTAALSDDFFRHADAAMLVYDATSSTSFSTLLGWYSDLVQRMKVLDENLHQKLPFPVLIVGNKIDILAARKRTSQPERQKLLIPQRTVLGLTDGYHGKDIPYEYRVDPPVLEPKVTSPRRVKEIREITSTYMATHGEWINDGCYLDSVLNSEDRSHPDQDMVLLWCLRNGLKHVEASALDGTGVHKAMESLVSMALEYKSERDRLLCQEKNSQKTISLGNFRINKDLDLHGRYVSNQQGECCCWFPRLGFK